jgi:hypothetical protein
MNATAQRVAEAVHANEPATLCFSCLAAQQRMKEHDVRDVAVVLVARAGLGLAQRPCSSCRRVADVLLGRHAA